MSRQLWLGAAALVMLLGGCGGSQPRSAQQPPATSQSTPATTPTATTPVAAPHSAAGRPKARSGGGTGRRPPRTVHTTATSTAPAAAGKGRAPTKSGGGGSQTAGAITVTLILHGGGSARIVACGSEHHYRTYPSGATVAFSGTVHPIPSGRWKVKLKVKVCRGGSYSDFAKLDATRDKHTGTFSGSFRAPAAGIYEARATLYVGGSETAKSDKRHFATR